MSDICGIYMIQNRVNGTVYIGQTSTIHKRFTQHRSELNHNRHVNKHLQCAWNTYGENSFDFSILEECNVSDLDERETYWIEYYDAMRSGYNQTLGGGGKRGLVTPKSVSLKRTGKNAATENTKTAGGLSWVFCQESKVS